MTLRFSRDLCVVCSAGGHLSEALLATSEVSLDTCYVTKADVHVAGRLQGRSVYYVRDPHTSVFGYLINALQTIVIFVRERPRIVFTTGAGIAIPLCVFAWLYGSQLIYLESGARVSSLSRTGRLFYRMADVFYVQWPQLLELYPRATYAGRLQ